MTGRSNNPPPLAEPREPGARAFVWIIWLVLVIAGLGFVLRFGPQVPIGDDYAIVSTLTGDRPITLGWLWSLHNEHRLPLHRLVLLSAYRVSGNDFRAGMVATVIALGLASAALMIGS